MASGAALECKETLSFALKPKKPKTQDKSVHHIYCLASCRKEVRPVLSDPPWIYCCDKDMASNPAIGEQWVGPI